MTFHHPPIAALRALEAAARHLNFTKAAAELHVTQSAVSHQIRHIEELWGFKLFEKRGRMLILSESGQAVVPIIRDFLGKLASTVESLQGTSGGVVRVSLLQSLALKWLVPRLGRFNTGFPDIEVWISTSESLVDFSADNVDIAIRLGHGDYPGLKTIPLLQEFLFPVASPRFLRHHGTPEEPADLLRYPLLYRTSFDICPRWRDWFRDAGVDARILPRGSHFPDTSMAVQAAIDEQGVALARSAHVVDDIEAGRLVKLFQVYSVSNVAYYLLCRPGQESSPHITGFIHWLSTEARLSQEEFTRQGEMQHAA